METITPHHSIIQARSALEKGRLEVAFKNLKDCFSLLKKKNMYDDNCKHIENNFTLSSGEFHSIKEREKLGLAEQSYLDVNRNRIRETLIGMVDELEGLINGNLTTEKGAEQEKVEIVLTLNKDQSDFDQIKFLNDLSNLLQSNDVKIKSIKFGSVKVTLELTRDKAIELEELVKEGALPEWNIIDFKQEIPFEIDPIVLAVLKERKIKYEIRKEGLDLVRANLREANLRGADLRRADLSEAVLLFANLRGADLRGVDLRGADLIRANLRSADLRSANLRSADLRYANLSETDLSEADLWRADLWGAVLWEADLRFTNLNEARLRGATFHTSQKIYLIEMGIDTSIVNFVDDDGIFIGKGIEIDVL